MGDDARLKRSSSPVRCARITSAVTLPLPFVTVRPSAERARLSPGATRRRYTNRRGRQEAGFECVLSVGSLWMAAAPFAESYSDIHDRPGRMRVVMMSTDGVTWRTPSPSLNLAIEPEPDLSPSAGRTQPRIGRYVLAFRAVAKTKTEPSANRTLRAQGALYCARVAESGHQLPRAAAATRPERRPSGGRIPCC